MKTKAILLLAMTAYSLSSTASQGSTTSVATNPIQAPVPKSSSDSASIDSSRVAAVTPDSAGMPLDSIVEMAQRAEAMSINTQKQSELNFLWSLGIAILALIVAIGALMKARKAASKVQKLLKQTSKAQKETDNPLSDIRRKVSELSQKNGYLEKRIDKLTRELEDLQKAQTVQSQSRTQGMQNPVPATMDKKYAWNVTDNAFGPSDCTAQLNSHTMAILTCSSDRRGTFVINSAPEAQAELFYNADKGFKLIADIVKQKPNPTHIVTLKPGTLVLQNGCWIITSKAQVALE